jgi:ribosomal protein L37AE/L43A
MICPHCKNDDATLLERVRHGIWFCVCCAKEFKWEKVN